MIMQGEIMRMSIVIFFFFTYSLFSFLTLKNASIGAMKEIGINSRFYPKEFIVPPYWIKKVFKIKQKTIPKYLVFELFLSVFFLTLGPVNVIVFFLFQTKRMFITQAMFQSCLIVLNFIYFFIMFYRYCKR